MPNEESRKQSSHDVVARKQALRKTVRVAVRKLTQEETASQSQRVWDQIIELPAYQAATSVGLFLSMPQHEIKTDFILEHAIRQKKAIWVPRVGANFEKCEMDLLKVVGISGEPDSLPEVGFQKLWPTNKWKIPEPPTDAPVIPAQPGDIDLLIVPGLAFDENANRLGQGKGYYDRFIARMNTDPSKSLPLVAVGLDPQLVVDQDIPVAEYDRRMDIVVLPSRIIRSSFSSSS